MKMKKKTKNLLKWGLIIIGIITLIIIFRGDTNTLTIVSNSPMGSSFNGGGIIP